eukprot:234141_1
MDGTRQQLMKQKKSRPSTNSKSKTPRTPPKYSNGKSKATGSKSISYATSPNPTPKGTVLRFDQPVNHIIRHSNNNNNYNLSNTHKTYKRSKSNPTSPQYNLNDLSKMNILYSQLKRKRKKK